MGVYGKVKKGTGDAHPVENVVGSHKWAKPKSNRMT